MVKKKIFIVLFLLLSLPIVLYVMDHVQQLLIRATVKKANIVIDAKQTLGPLPELWRAFAQGGEEPPPMLSNTIPRLRTLSPRLIRIDHIYDAYGVVKRAGEGYVYDFSQLDKTVDDIIASGAVPFFSLSYMPPSFTQSGSVIDIPVNWTHWKDLVKKTIDHYSGKTGKNLTGVYYEVWNEPELPQFGSFRLSAQKDYRLLYFYAATGAGEVQNTNRFFLGGPAVGSYYPNWVYDFVSYIEQNKLRLDFYSWHRYHKNPDMFATDARNIKKLLDRTNHKDIPLIISEWGIESGNDPINNSNTAASFTVSAISKMLADVSLAFVFEIKDGPPGGGGTWGLLTHEKDKHPLSPKPRFEVFSSLAKMSGERVALAGLGTYVTGFASRTKDSTIQVILSNYDLSGQNTEQVPVTFTGLAPASYTFTYTYVLDGTTAKQEIISTDGSVKKIVLLPANSVVSIELSASGSLASFIPGRSGQDGDQALVLSANDGFIFSSPEFRLRPQGKISFDMKPFWSADNNSSFNIFDAPFSTESGKLQRLFLARQKKAEGIVLAFGISSTREDASISLPISWAKDTWHHIDLSWDPKKLTLAMDNSPVNSLAIDMDIRNGELLTFYPIDAGIDNLNITLGENQLIQRLFDGRIDK